jgi:DNA-binding beta-propeller fold protein YncE
MNALKTLLLPATAALLTPAALHAQHGAPMGDVAYDSVFYAWEAGDYPDALHRLDRLLSAPDASRYLHAAAELTGEVFRTTELTTDGLAVRWSPDSRHAAFEAGTGVQRRTHVYAFDGGRAREVAVLNGAGLAFDGDGRAAYVAGDANTVTVRDLTSGRETQFAAQGLTVQSIAFRPGDASVFVLAPTGAAASDVYRLGAGAPERITRGPGAKTNPVWLSDGRVLYGIDRQTFGVEDLRTGATLTISGSGAAASADGSTIAWVEQDGGESVLRVLRAGDAGPRTVLRSRDALSSPALSRDGRRIVYQRMPREDWELYVVNADGSGEQRLTREVQHDVLPRFIDDTTVFALMGEARHRRSFLYDVVTGTRTRFFHNNTVRTVAPEYEWAVSPDGTKVLIVADRDGDTVSPERGVYVTDLTRRVTLDEVRSRMRAQLAHELQLRERGARLFTGLEDRVRAAVSDVSKDRAYRYSYDLYQFDSKHITQPGNLQAME